MDPRINELVVFTKRKLGLDNYHLFTHRLRRTVNFFNETVYTLEMEWFPSHVKGREEDGLNPEGAACIDLDVHTRKFQSIVFVGGKTYASGVMFKNADTNDVIAWIEQETALKYGEQFHLVNQEERKLLFQASIGGTAIYPSGSIEIQFGEDGRLIFYAVHGPFPSKGLISEERFTLSLDQIKSLAKEQLRLMEFPSWTHNRIVPMYVMEEIFVTNAQKEIVPFEPVADGRPYLKIEQPMHWDDPFDQTFERQEIDWGDEVTPEQAFSNEPSPDSYPITKLEQEKCVQTVLNVLRQEYPRDTGKWILKTLHRDNGYIHAVLRTIQDDHRAFKRKLVVIIDAKTFQALNYLDNRVILDTFHDRQAPGDITVTKDEALDKLEGKIALTTYYVYHPGQKRYVLCGKLDCKYGVNAENGEVMEI